MQPPQRPFYYLENFRSALSWLRTRYVDLLLEQELAFIRGLASVPVESAALLVRMIMRQGDLFRTSKLQYPEIGNIQNACEPLVELGWIDPRPELTLAQLCSLLRAEELQSAFSLKRRPKLRTQVTRQLLLDLGTEESRPMEHWWKLVPDRALRVNVAGLCERLRLMYFGNFRQDWAAFVLVDMGVQRFEALAIEDSARAFQTRAQIDHFHTLYRLRERVAHEVPEQILESVPPPLADCSWMEVHRSKLLFTLGQRLEKSGRQDEAVRAYAGCKHPHARIRTVRALEKSGRFAEATAQLTAVEEEPASEFETQSAVRIRTRLQRRLGLTLPRAAAQPRWLTFEVALQQPDPPRPVEQAVRDHLHSDDAPAFYVENGLLNSLFGLLCWNALFAQVPGAFFHPFHAAPVDLFDANFRIRREAVFDECFAQLDNGMYRDTILTTFAAKRGIQTAFVAWELLTPELLSLALKCVPPAHLRACFDRLLADLRANRSGMPDLIQFRPARQDYRMIEVKGPGDRLQDNQVRWLNFCATNGLCAQVCAVRWSARSSTP